MTDYRSPATTTNHYTTNTDPTGAPAITHTSTTGVHGATGHVATLGHPADGVVINQGLNTAHTTHSTTVPVATTHTTHTTTTVPVATTHKVVQPAVTQPVAHHTIPSGANGDGLMVNSNLGGPLGGTVVLGGQCECLRNGGKCSHGAGQCTCRGCTTAATSINPGINIGVSTHQYTAPVGTSGIGGGVADPGVGMAGVVAPTNAAGQHVNSTLQNCECVKNGGVCNCAPGQCKCTNCTAHRKSLAATNAAHTVGHGHTGTSTTTAPVTTSTTSTTTRNI